MAALELYSNSSCGVELGQMRLKKRKKYVKLYGPDYGAHTDAFKNANMCIRNYCARKPAYANVHLLKQ